MNMHNPPHPGMGQNMQSVPLSGLKVVKGEKKLRLYQFDTKEAEHYFCSICGIYTHHKRIGQRVRVN